MLHSRCSAAGECEQCHIVGMLRKLNTDLFDMQSLFNVPFISMFDKDEWHLGTHAKQQAFLEHSRRHLSCIWN